MRMTSVEAVYNEAQNAKMQEINELLVAAGYFRARIKGLSPFDKIVGGLAWGIEVCAVDIDVDLPFNENLNIGQKISLTEKIVAVLPRMKCPHRIEPHQIQGLDYEHIFPVVQWLVKKAIETKAETEDIHRQYAVYLFNKGHSPLPQEEALKEPIEEGFCRSYKALQDRYCPKRKYRHHSRHLLTTEALQVEATLLEYGVRTAGANRTRSSSGSKEDAADVVATQAEESTSALISSMAPLAAHEGKLTSKAVGSLVEMQTAEIQQIAEDYSRKQLSLAPGVSKQERMLNSIQRQLEAKQQILEKCRERVDKLRADYEAKQKDQREADKALKAEEDATERLEMGSGDDEPLLRKLCALLRLDEELGQQETEFRRNCREEMKRLQGALQELGSAEEAKKSPAGGAAMTEEEDKVSQQLEQDREKLQHMRMLLAKKNREIAVIQRKIDEVPSRAELSQYQRRFIELYSQVSATHKETKQFYTLYNTLDDIRVYLDKEIGLLNSILETFTDAMNSPAAREQFLVQFEKIVEGVKQNRLKVEKKRQEAKGSRDHLHDQYLELVDKQRLYFKTVKEFKEECRKNESLVGKLKEQSARQS
ncbi:coiled-coil domain-containing protein 93-like [Ornithodoros turicata]|uniref:coiled-coil domain-containing protein 93-like n=1 Tax=Ornithodoros turicata TaxID=34597 RepID=UPI003138FD8E